MDELAERFEAQRPRLRAVAHRMLGSATEADDAVQEAWLRLSRVDADEVENLPGWLTTVVSRVCLDMLRSRSSRREEPIEHREPDLAPPAEEEALLGEAIGSALLVVLDTLAPAERLAFVLHDLFGVPFHEVAAIIGRSPAATRQLASRARRRVQGSPEPESPADRGRQRRVVEAFLAASRGGDFAALVALLDEGVVLRADPVAVGYGADAEVLGPDAVARTFVGRARAARLTLVDGLPGAAWTVDGTPRVVFDFVVEGDRIAAITLLADPDHLGALPLEPLED